ncbi:16S rRNA (guanine(527)-N(7))-methyltransferase RsmG [Allopusillimonas ginsengisoli]|uniref:16S rRNA (guanine(527)-N(7))-methyltransferase RsmG n=1 Tax=Allopusillimonas ginsengisoli TaxID=453575 RepID=UPI0010C17157|nr:16S rRNA (guanine(527)-N(7))-methyltransferase RsmG [Allopusillimonas ginsengisoli]
MSSTDHYPHRIIAAGVAMGLVISQAQADAMVAYINQLVRWNRTYNLTALRNTEQMLVQHVFDSLSVITPIGLLLDKNTVSNPTVVDVGSGAGLPGVILALMRPDCHVYCVDAVEKKMAFVRQVAGVLALPNLKAVHQRVESLQPYDADIVVSRAFASLVDFATLAGRHVAEKGHLVAMKGRSPDEEVDTLHRQTDWQVDCIEPLQVPELNAQRCLVWMSRQGNV